MKHMMQYLTPEVEGELVLVASTKRLDHYLLTACMYMHVYADIQMAIVSD